jgi:hypothetical protein
MNAVQKVNCLCLLWVILCTQSVFGQRKLPVIQAHSEKVAIRDGAYLDNNAWTLAPEAKPDVFTADRTRRTKWVTFYTDSDAIKVKVKPGTIFDFVILRDGKDSCFTRIVSAIPPQKKQATLPVTHDTIPFVLTAYNAIHVKAVVNDQDTLNLHFDVGSFDFRFTRDAIFQKTHLLSHQPDALAGTAKPNYNRLDEVFKIQMGKMIFLQPEIVPTGFTAHDMDGRFGWNLFEGKSVEIDYDQRLLIIHSERPKHLASYSKSKLEFLRSFVCMKGALQVDRKQYKGNFLLDTGSDQAIILDSSWVSAHAFPQDLKLLKSSELKDPRGVIYLTKIVLAPLVQVNGYQLSDVPIYLLPGKNPVGLEVNYFGNDLLKRFNTILDFKHDRIYLKPNQLMSMPYRSAS